MDSLIDISIIIPCHNLEKYMSPMLYSLQSLDLTNINYEIIFILDDCKDNTLDIITSKMKNMKILISECKVHSCGLARNIGLEQAKGEYIWFIDGDDWIIYPYVIKDCLEILKEQDLEIIQIPFVSNFYKIQHFSMVWQYIYKRSFIGDLRFGPFQPHEDLKFNNTLLNRISNNKLISYNIPSYFYNYNRPGSNMTQFRENEKIVP